MVFYEITKGEVQRAVAEPRDLSLDLVNAQQARRALDYLVGFNLSPLLWKKVRRGLSAGRVQSPALRMICEREHEISIFKPQEYWTLEAEGEHSTQTFPLKLVEFDGKKVEQFSFTDEAAARGVEQSIKDAAQGFLHVISIDRKQRRRNPSPPFTTSTLQQEAARKLGYSAQRTMRLAQQLYEGVDFGEGSIGLITYMRTDSVNLADDAVREMREVIAKEYGKEAVAEEPRVYKTKSRNAQEAHEAIRPTSAAILPSRVEGKIDPDQYKLYALIWKRAVASQMAHALFDTVAVDMMPSKQPRPATTHAASRHVLRANGSTLIKPGYIAVYQEDVDDGKPENENDRILPAMKDGDVVTLLNVHGDQHFTEPPPRFSEASLVKALEEHGIGRPSTYATIISTLKDREYVDMDNRRFIPTDIGKIVGSFLSKHFHKYVEYGFTAVARRRARRGVARRRGLDRAAQEILEAVHHAGRAHREERLARRSGAGARARQASGERQADHGTHGPLSARSCRSAPRTTRRSRSSPACAPARRWTLIKLPEALELFKLPRKLGATADGEPVEANIGRFGPYIKYGAKVRVAQAAGRSVHGRAGARARGDPPEEGSGRQPHHPGLRRRQHPGAERPLRPVHHRRQAQRAHARRTRTRRPSRSSICRELLAVAPLRGSRFGRKKTGRAGRGASRACSGKRNSGEGREEIRRQGGQSRLRRRRRRSPRKNRAGKKSAARANAKSAASVPARPQQSARKPEGPVFQVLLVHAVDRRAR